MKVSVYLDTASSPRKYPVLKSFGKGVQKFRQDKVIFVRGKKLVPADVAVILGFYGNFKPALNDPTHLFRKKIYDYQIKRNKNIIFIDRDFFADIGSKIENQLDPHHFFRISMGSIYFNEGIHFNHIKTPKRWKTIKNAKKIKSIGPQISEENILICLNNGEFGKSWATKNVEMLPWALDTANKIREITDKNIVIRFHPKIKPYLQDSIPIEIFDGIDNLYFSGGIKNNDPRVLKDRSMIDEVLRAKVSVFYNSSASIVPALFGRPIITEHKSCPSYDVANHSIEDILNPKVFPRNDWLEKLSNCLWSPQEMQSGVLWDKIRKHLTHNGDISKKAFKEDISEYKKYIKYYYNKF